MANEKLKARILPHSIEAEQAVLGCVLIDEDEAQVAILSELKEESFYSTAHKKIFSAMYAIYSSSRPVDFITLTEELEKKEQLNDIGGINYITTLTNVVPSAANFKHYLEIVKKDSVLRRLIKASEKIIENSFGGEDKETALTFAEKSIFDIADKEDSSNLSHIEIALTSVIEKFEAIQKDPSGVKGVPTGFYALDKITNGLQKSDLILLAARPAVGKTSFAMNIINNAAIGGAKCAVFAMEMPKEQLAQRALCSTAFVSMEKALKGELNIKEWEALWEANKKLSNASIFIDDSSLNTPVQILSKCRRLKREKGLDLVMIDYLQLMSSGSKNKESRQQEVSEMSRTLKVAARELNVPIILLSQLSRAVESRKGGKPILSDLRESGAIEQDADIVMFIHNPDLYNDGEDPLKPKQGIVELIIAKHRNGALNNIKLKFISEHTTFVDLNKDSNNRSLEDVAPPPKTSGAVDVNTLPEITPLEGNEDITDIF